MQPVLGNNVRALEGVIRNSTADSLTIAVEQTITETQGIFVSSGTTVAVARPFIESVAVRQVSRRKSTILSSV